jgi:hypothetical protein
MISYIVPVMRKDNIMNVLVYRTKHMGKHVDYSNMVDTVFKVFKETTSTFVLHSSEKYKFVTTVSKRDCKITDNPHIKYNW